MRARIMIPVINGAIGESIFADELKGDFVAAGELAERATVGAGPEVDLARGVLRLLKGEPKVADAYLARVQAADDPELSLRAVTFRSVAAVLDRNYFPDGGGARGPEINAGWKSFQTLFASYAQAQAALASQVANHSVQLECAAATSLIISIVSDRAILAASAAAPVPADHHEAAVRTARQFRARYDATADPAVIAYADLVLAGLYRGAGWIESAWQSLQQSRDGYAALGDDAGRAGCFLLEGDWRSAPFGSPLTWNMARHSTLSAQAETEEFRRADPAALDIAAASYGEAERLFEAANAGRGLAAVR
jgi:hypothetical protein